MTTRRVAILGSTGSIGTQTLAVIDHLNALHAAGKFPDRYEVVALATGANHAALEAQAQRYGVQHIAVADSETACSERCLKGANAATQLIREIECDLVVCAMVGAAGLRPTLEAIALGRDIALANKETLVAGGQIVIAKAGQTGSRIFPIDSEHAAAWQLMQSLDSSYTPPDPAPAGIARLTLTASGGPFRAMPAERLKSVTPEQALRHPTWSMGPKNTIDSATLMNKALELIEARWLFDLPADKLDALIQPTSVVHAILETVDGSCLAQLSRPDMRLPIQQAITHPHRARTCVDRLDMRSLAKLSFESLDQSRFGAIELAQRVMRMGDSAGAIFNAVNEIAVRAFLDERLAFTEITWLVGRALDAIEPHNVESLEDVLEVDAIARRWAIDRVSQAARV